MKLTIRLDQHTHRSLRFLSVERGESVQVIVERLIREYLGRAGKRNKKARLGREV